MNVLQRGSLAQCNQCVGQASTERVNAGALSNISTKHIRYSPPPLPLPNPFLFNDAEHWNHVLLKMCYTLNADIDVIHKICDERRIHGRIQTL